MGSCLSSFKNHSGSLEVTHTNLSNEVMENEILESSKLKNFSFAFLQAATNNFHKKSMEYEDSNGCIFKGMIGNKSSASNPTFGTVISVKQYLSGSIDTHEELFTWLKYSPTLDHPNLVKLVGYCLDGNHMLLAFEHMANGCLETYTSKRNLSFRPLSWNNRIKIALDAAKGLAYLHSDEVNIIFRDFKLSNILLDEKYNGKLYGLELARSGPAVEESHVSTRVIGTVGYVAPEYLATGHLTTKCDVYAFGVVLTEMLISRKISDVLRLIREQNIDGWVTPLAENKGEFLKMMEAENEGQCSITGAENAATLAMQCLSTDPNGRPTMPQVVEALQQLLTDMNPSQ